MIFSRVHATPSVCPSAHHAVRIHAERLSNLPKCPCPPARDWCTWVYGLVYLSSTRKHYWFYEQSLFILRDLVFVCSLKSLNGSLWGNQLVFRLVHLRLSHSFNWLVYFSITLLKCVLFHFGSKVVKIEPNLSQPAGKWCCCAFLLSPLNFILSSLPPPSSLLSPSVLHPSPLIVLSPSPHL